MAWPTIWSLPPGPALGPTYCLSGNLRNRLVPVCLPAGAGALGHAAVYARVARAGYCIWDGGLALAACLGRGRSDAGFFSHGGWRPGRTSRAAPAPWRPPLPLIDHAAVLCPTPGPVLLALPDAPLCVQSTPNGQRECRQPGYADGTDGPPRARLLE